MNSAQPRPLQRSTLVTRKIESLGTRARMLTNLREALDLKPQQNIRPEQWEVLENQLAAVSNTIRRQLKLITDRYFSEQYQPGVRQTLLNRLGELELDLTEAYSFYDTFMDILTQRLSDGIGPLLRGCDVIAADGLQRGFLAEMTTMPLVYCDRGFGASTLREGVSINRQVPNPIPFIGIPYARMVEKYNLMSIYHEVGHQAMVKLNMVGDFRNVYSESVARTGASPLLRSLFANWSSELLPDFWAFGHTGLAQTSSIRDVLVLPQGMMFTISANRPHPPAYLRFLLSVEWCRTLWGKGDWDDWEAEWQEQYPVADLDVVSRETIEAARQLLPVVARATLHTKFRKLNGKTLTDLFDLDQLNPGRIKKLANRDAVTSDAFRAVPIGVQLAAFRLLRETRQMKLNELDTLMGVWLKSLELNSLKPKN